MYFNHYIFKQCNDGSTFTNAIRDDTHVSSDQFSVYYNESIITSGFSHLMNDLSIICAVITLNCPLLSVIATVVSS